MKKNFIHKAVFRLLSPVFSGIVVYLLILLINNNVEQIFYQFLGEELYVCIGLSYIIQEFSRGFLIVTTKFYKTSSLAYRLTTQVLLLLFLSILLVSVFITLYYKYVVGYDVAVEELYVFNAIFCCLTVLYILLYVSHEYLHKVNSEKLLHEELIKQNIEEDFKQFKKEINPNLLFESLEALLLLIKENTDKSDDLIDHLATIYRYILSNRDRQLVEISTEINALSSLEKLFNYLPYRSITIKSNISSEFLIIPGSLLYIVEGIVKSTIRSATNTLAINLSEDDDYLFIDYIPNNSITNSFNLNTIEEIIDVYSIYSKIKLTSKHTDTKVLLRLPKLKIEK